MKDLIKKYWKIVLYGLLSIIAIVIVWKGLTFIYKNTYAHENYKYASKSYQNLTFDQNVSIVKNIKRNGTEGDIKITFDKKDLNEEYNINLDKDINPANVEIGVEGKINLGDMTVRLVDDKNTEIFTRIVKGPNIKEVSTPNVSSRNYRLIITPSGAQNGDIEVKFKF